jgi:hypothetical protein
MGEARAAWAAELAALAERLAAAEEADYTTRLLYYCIHYYTILLCQRFPPENLPPHTHPATPLSGLQAASATGESRPGEAERLALEAALAEARAAGRDALALAARHVHRAQASKVVYDYTSIRLYYYTVYDYTKYDYTTIRLNDETTKRRNDYPCPPLLAQPRAEEALSLLQRRAVLAAAPPEAACGAGGGSALTAAISGEGSGAAAAAARKSPPAGTM